MGLDSYIRATVLIEKQTYPEPPPPPPGIAAALEALKATGIVANMVTVGPDGPAQGEEDGRYNRVLSEALGISPHYGEDHRDAWAYTNGLVPRLEVEFPVATWRKVYSIHEWFARRIEKDTNEKIISLRGYNFERDVLSILRTDVGRVLETVVRSPEVTVVPRGERDFPWDPESREVRAVEFDVDLAKTVFPVSIDEPFDDWLFRVSYIEDLEYTHKRLTEIIEDPALIEARFSYLAWW